MSKLLQSVLATVRPLLAMSGSVTATLSPVSAQTGSLFLQLALLLGVKVQIFPRKEGPSYERTTLYKTLWFCPSSAPYL